MRTRALIAAGALAATGLATGMAAAAPNVTSVEANRVGRGRLEVVVQLDRGTVSTPSTVDVTVNGRTRHARALDWGKATQPTDTVTYVAQFRGGGGASAGSTLDVRFQACDGAADCTTSVKTVTVVRTRPIGARIKDNPANTPLPADAIDSASAAKVALAAVGDGSTLIEIERADELNAAWEVKVLRADGARVKVYVAADGTVLATRVEAPRSDGHVDHPDHQPAAPAPGAVPMEQAIAAALAWAGDGSVMLEAKVENEAGVAYEVKVQKADSTRWEVKVAPDGSVVSGQQDD